MRTYRKQFAVFLLSVFFVSTLLLAPAQAAVLDDVRTIIEAAYVDPVDETVLQAESIEEILEKLNDPYSVYFTVEQYQNFLDSLGDSTFSGLGVQLESVSEGVLVIKVVSGSSAEEVNIKAGDIIISVDGQSLIGMTVEEAVPLIRGPENSEINLIIKRGESKLSLSALRKVVVVPSVKAELLASNIGYIDIDSFGLQAPGQFSLALDDLRSKGAKSFIIDLRNNTGGYLSSALNIAGYFLGNHPALNTEVKNNKTQTYHAIDHANIIYEPTIFLVNEYSASASEILAAAVQDHNKALLIGTATYGKGTLQTLFRLLSGEGYLKLTTARYFSPKGHSIEAKGITPNLIIKEHDPLMTAQILLGDATDLDHIILRIGTLDYTVDARMVNNPAYWSCYEEIISQLPDYTLYRLSEESNWQSADSQQLDERWSFYYPSYTKLSHLEGVPEDKQFSLTFPQNIDRKSVNKETVELIETNTGQRISLNFLYLGSRQVILTPKAKLEAGKTYWLVVHTGDTSNITTITVGPTQDAIIVAGMEGGGNLR